MCQTELCPKILHAFEEFKIHPRNTQKFKNRRRNFNPNTEHLGGKTRIKLNITIALLFFFFRNRYKCTYSNF